MFDEATPQVPVQEKPTGHLRPTLAEVDVNGAILAVARLGKRGAATDAAVNAMLLKLIGSDALSRAVQAAVGGGR